MATIAEEFKQSVVNTVRNKKPVYMKYNPYISKITIFFPNNNVDEQDFHTFIVPVALNAEGADLIVKHIALDLHLTEEKPQQWYNKDYFSKNKLFPKAKLIADTLDWHLQPTLTPILIGSNYAIHISWMKMGRKATKNVSFTFEKERDDMMKYIEQILKDEYSADQHDNSSDYYDHDVSY